MLRSFNEYLWKRSAPQWGKPRPQEIQNKQESETTSPRLCPDFFFLEISWVFLEREEKRDKESTSALSCDAVGRNRVGINPINTRHGSLCTGKDVERHLQLSRTPNPPSSTQGKIRTRPKMKFNAWNSWSHWGSDTQPFQPFSDQAQGTTSEQKTPKRCRDFPQIRRFDPPVIPRPRFGAAQGQRQPSALFSCGLGLFLEPWAPFSLN